MSVELKINQGGRNLSKKVQVLDVVEIDGKMYTVDKNDKKSMKSVYATLVGSLALTPTTVFAAGDDTFHRIWETIMNGLDWMAAFVIVFSGVAWMLGHRTKAIELIIGVCLGFVLARHALDIVDLLKTI